MELVLERSSEDTELIEWNYTPPERHDAIEADTSKRTFSALSLLKTFRTRERDAWASNTSAKCFGTKGCGEMRVLALTEDRSKQAPETLRRLLNRMFRLVDKPKQVLHCVSDKHNADFVVRNWPADEVFAAERSFHDVVLSMLEVSEIGEALESTWNSAPDDPLADLITACHSPAYLACACSQYLRFR